MFLSDIVLGWLGSVVGGTHAHRSSTPKKQGGSSSPDSEGAFEWCAEVANKAVDGNTVEALDGKGRGWGWRVWDFK